MTLRDAGREFARLTGGLAVPKQHVELMQCVLNNTLGELYPVALTVWHSIPDDKRANIPVATMNRMIDLLQFFEHTAEAAKTGESPALAAQRQREKMLTADTDSDIRIVPLSSANETSGG